MKSAKRVNLNYSQTYTYIVCLKYIQFLFVNYTSIKLEKILNAKNRIKLYTVRAKFVSKN